MSWKYTGLAKRSLTAIVAGMFLATIVAPTAWAQAPSKSVIDQMSLEGNWYNYVPFDKPLSAPACNASQAPLVGGPADIDVDIGFNLGGDPVTRRVNLMKTLIRDFPPLSPEQAAGVVGNFMVESGGEDLPPDMNEGLRGRPKFRGPPSFRGGYGWAQWTGGRQTQFIDDFAVPRGYMVNRNVAAKDDANYAFLKFELGTTERGTLPALRGASTPEEAAIAFERAFERARVQAHGPRSIAARKVFNEFNGGQTGAPQDPSILPPAQQVGQCAPPGGNGGAIVGGKKFPLDTTKAGILNRNIFRNNTTDRAGHPYIAFDILAAPGTKVVAFTAGRVKSVSTDRCPGRMISVFDDTSDITTSYLHLEMNGNVPVNTIVQPGDFIGTVGVAARGCGTPHLHIDAVNGPVRVGCSRLRCPPANARLFIDLGPDLFTTFQTLPDGGAARP